MCVCVCVCVCVSFGLKSWEKTQQTFYIPYQTGCKMSVAVKFYISNRIDTRHFPSQCYCVHSVIVVVSCVCAQSKHTCSLYIHTLHLVNNLYFITYSFNTHTHTHKHTHTHIDTHTHTHTVYTISVKHSHCL